ncbi:MAG: hypothetical protein WA728_28295, partial [Xanthobacteraceae bacterium]
YAMRRIFLLGGMLLVAAGVTALVFRMPKQVAAQHLASPAVPIDPAILRKYLQDMREEMTLP